MCVQNWARGQMKLLRQDGADDITLVRFLMTQRNRSVVIDYVHAYLGKSAATNAFAEELLKCARPLAAACLLAVSSTCGTNIQQLMLVGTSLQMPDATELQSCRLSGCISARKSGFRIAFVLALAWR